MAATDTYHDLPKLGRVKLPNETEYALIDYNGRELIAPVFKTSLAYSVGDLVIYEDELYRFTTAHAAGAWNANQVVLTDVESELARLWGAVTGGIHYIGTTTSPIYDGATTNPIIVNGGSITANAGDLAILDLSATGIATELTYPIDLVKNHYYKVTEFDNSIYYIATESVENVTSWEMASEFLNKIGGALYHLEFVWSGSRWDAFGGATAFGDLAFRDSASGSYTRPSGSGSVTVKEYSAEKARLVTASITGVNGTESVSKMTSGTAVEVAKAAATSTTVATAGSEVVYGTADVGTAVTYGNANVGSAVTGVAKVNTTQRTFTTEGIKVVGVDDDCLKFTSASTGNIYGVESTGVSITPAVASNTTLTPAVAADTTRKVRGVGGTTTVTSAVSNGTITPWSETAKTVAKAASSATTVATGTVSSTGTGSEVVTGISSTDVQKPVSVGTQSATVTVK